MKKKITEFIVWLKKRLFYTTLKNVDLKVVYCWLFDLLFYGLLFVFSALGGLAMRAVDLSPLYMLQNPETLPLASELNAVLIKFSSVIILLFVLVVIAWSLTRFFIYNIILKKKFSYSKLWKFSVFNLVVFFLHFLLLYILSIIIMPDLIGAVGFFFLLVFAYCVNITYIIYLKERKFWSSLRKALKLAFTKIHRLLPAYLLGFFLIIFSVSVLNWLFSFLNVSNNPSTSLFISFISLLVLIFGVSWLRFYIVAVVEKIS